MMEEEKPQCLQIQSIPFQGHVALGMHGEKVEFRHSQIITPDMIPEGACKQFRETLLKVFGPGGSRNLQGDAFMPTSLGKHPMAKVRLGF
jgi:hypothetical protein